MAICVAIGFSSGLPLFCLFQLVTVWLRRADVDIAAIGLLALTGLPYSYKFLWAPFLDRFVLPVLGRRRGWMFVTQVLLTVLLGAFCFLDPLSHMTWITVLMVAVAFVGASQDIVIDAYRRELLPDHELGLGTSIHVNAYRLSALVPGSLGLILADHLPWSQVFVIVAAFMLVGLITTLLINEPITHGAPPQTLRQAVVAPFKEFFGRHDLRWAVAVMAFMVLYKLGDNMATALESVFFVDLGFTNTQIGAVAKLAKLWSMVLGTVLGGLAMVKLGVYRALWVFGVFQILSILGYLVLSVIGPDPVALFVAVSLEYLGVGLGTVALVAFIAKLSSTRFTAVQISLLTSLTALPRSIAAALTGYMIEAVGYTSFFFICFLCAIPGMLMLFFVAPWNGYPDEQ
ncbi:MAG: AmpG family muropeptide MFS transporter [Pseudomonadota bacterium]